MKGKSHTMFISIDNVVTVVFLPKINNENVKSYVQNDTLHGALGQVCRQGLSVWHPLSVTQMYS